MMADKSRSEAIQWLNSNPPRSFPPPDGWAWCEPDDKSQPWSLFHISMGPAPGVFDQFKDICETVRDDQSGEGGSDGNA